MAKINIVGDTHDVPALHRILSRLDNVYSLGDIVAVDTQDYLKNVSRYSKVWKAHAAEDLTTVTEEEIKWFHDINVDGWEKQLKMISESGKNLTVVRGNSDLRMLSLFPEMRKALQKATGSNPKFDFVEQFTYKTIDNVCIIFLPYRDDAYEGIDSVINNITSEFKKLFVLGHCPLYPDHEKKYYIHHFNAVKRISEELGELTYFHGHVHADKTYKYNRPELSKVTIITPKAEDCDEGMGFNHEYLEIDTNSGEIIIKKIDKEAESIFATPPSEYLEGDHWNSYIKPKT